MRILALIPGGIAEQLQFFPTLETLRGQYPEGKLDVVVEPRALSAYQVSGAVSEKIPFDFQARNSLADWGNLLGIVRDREYEVAIAPAPDWGVSFLLWMSGIPSRVSFANVPGANFYTQTIAKPTNLDVPAQYHSLLAGLGLTSPCPELKVSLATGDLDWADAERKTQGLTSGNYVAFYSPDTGYPANSWEIVLQDFQKKQPNLTLTWLQDGSNPILSSALKDRLPDLKLVQAGNLGRTIAFLAGASLAIVAEGPTMQAAIAAQTFTLGLCSTTDPNKMPKNDKFLGIKSSTGKLADIAPATLLEKVWNG
jgi:ADP-heptose:LPS heptosyltransferase